MTKDEAIANYLSSNFITIKRQRDGSPAFKDINSRSISPAKILEMVNVIIRGTGSLDLVEPGYLMNYLAVHAPMDNTAKQERTPPSQYVAEWLSAHANQWRISDSGRQIVNVDMGTVDYFDIEDLREAIQGDVSDQDLPYSVAEIQTALSNHMRSLYKSSKKRICDVIAYDEKYARGIDKWLRNFYDYLKPEESFEMFAMLLKHWGWQVKRKMLARPVVWHLWINFFGATGLGKSTAEKKLVAPLNDLAAPSRIGEILDATRQVKKLTEYYVLIVDELAVNRREEDGNVEPKLTDGEIAALKAVLTGDMLVTRVMQTQKQSTRPITFSCISSSNIHLYDVIYDPTSMRRFFEFHCTGKTPSSFDDINRTLDNSIYFWKGIDENLETGYWEQNSELGKEVTRIQMSYYPTKSSVYQWLKNVCATKGGIAATDAYPLYKQFCINCNYRGKSIENFLSDIRHAIPESVDGKGVPHIKFTPSSLCYKDRPPVDPANSAFSPAGNMDSIMKPASPSGGLVGAESDLDMLVS